jgi:hypothetical protein
MPFEGIEARGPHPPIRSKPLVDRSQRFCTHTVHTTLRLPSHVHEAGFPKDPQMLRDRGLAQLEPLDQLPDGSLRASEQVEDPPPVRFRENVKNGHPAENSLLGI